MTAYGVFLGLVRGLWSIVSIMEYPTETINIREGMGTAVRNVKHTKGWHFVIFGAWLMSEPEQQCSRSHGFQHLRYLKWHMWCAGNI